MPVFQKLMWHTPMAGQENFMETIYEIPYFIIKCSETIFHHFTHLLSCNLLVCATDESARYQSQPQYRHWFNC